MAIESAICWVKRDCGCSGKYASTIVITAQIDYQITWITPHVALALAHRKKPNKVPSRVKRKDRTQERVSEKCTGEAEEQKTGKPRRMNRLPWGGKRPKAFAVTEPWKSQKHREWIDVAYCSESRRKITRMPDKRRVINPSICIHCGSIQQHVASSRPSQRSVTW